MSLYNIGTFIYFLIDKKEIVLEKPSKGEKSTHEGYKQRPKT